MVGALPQCGGFTSSATALRIAGGGPGAGDFLCSPKESHQRKGFPGSPPLPRNLVWCPCAARPARRSAQLAHRSRYSKHIRREITAETHGYARLAQCSPETPGWSALLGGEQGPQDQDPSLLHCVTSSPGLAPSSLGSRRQDAKTPRNTRTIINRQARQEKPGTRIAVLAYHMRRRQGPKGCFRHCAGDIANSRLNARANAASDS